jgi:hypothetical protein
MIPESVVRRGAPGRRRFRIIIGFGTTIATMNSAPPGSARRVVKAACPDTCALDITVEDGRDEALDTIAAHFRAIAVADPQQILPVSYAGTMGIVRQGWQRLNVPAAPFTDGGFPTPSGKREFRSETAQAMGLDPLPDYTPQREGPTSNPELAKRYPRAFSPPHGIS